MLICMFTKITHLGRFENLELGQLQNQIRVPKVQTLTLTPLTA